MYAHISIYQFFSLEFYSFKETVPRDFRLQIFYMNFPQAPEYTIRAVSIFFPKILGDIEAQGAPPVPLTPAAN
jgi:hypothetical protein